MQGFVHSAPTALRLQPAPILASCMVALLACGNASKNTDQTSDAGADLSDAGGNVTDGSLQPDAALSPLSVSTPPAPLYTVGDWGNYVANDGTTRFSASGADCPELATGGYQSCLHTGEIRFVSLPEESSCASLSATDALSALVWHCDDSTGSVRMISTGLAPGKRLSDLLDLSLPQPIWRANTLTISDQTRSVTTESSTWWSNPISILNGGSLDTPGTVYVANAQPSVSYSMDADQVSLVIPSEFSAAVSAVAHNYLWVEGEVTSAAESGLFWRQVRFSVLRGVRAFSSGQSGIRLAASANNLLSDIIAIDNNSTGIYLEQTSQFNTFNRVASSNNGNSGISLRSSSFNRLSNVTLNNNGNNGMYLYFSSRILLANVALNNNGSTGLHTTEASLSVFSNITTANNGPNRSGIVVNRSLHLMVTNVASLNNGNSGIFLGLTSNNTIHNFAATHNGNYGILMLDTSTENYVTGRTKLGENGVQDCSMQNSTSGLIDTSCALQGTSDATVSTGVVIDNALVGPITVDDPVNGSDQDGRANTVAAASADWIHFATPSRNWSPDSDSTFPHVDFLGECLVGCQIFDYALTSLDAGDNGAPVLHNQSAQPSGDVTHHQLWYQNSTQELCDAIPGALWEPSLCDAPGYFEQASCEAASHLWGSQFCASVFLQNATEISGDGIGNDNTLCESNETCLYSPNIGAYQGHGEVVSAGAFTDGTLVNIRLLKYENNGY